MIRSLILAFVLLALTTNAQLYIPPDYFHEPYKNSIGFWENSGQLHDTHGYGCPEVKYYSEGGFPRAFLQEKSRVSFVIADVDTAISTVDTLYRLDMRPYGPHAHDASPVSEQQKDWTQNYYLAHCGTTGVEAVNGFCRVVYPNIFPSIDMHFYSGSMSQKMAFVMRPGCDPDDLKLAFTGQDSMAVDLWGNLLLYYDGKYIVLPFAQAYQVGAGNTVTPVSWSAAYNVDNGEGIVSFSYSSYDPELPLVFQVGVPPLGTGSYDEPGLCWSTYLGGPSEELVVDSDQDPAQRMVLAGTTTSTITEFPPAVGNTYYLGGTVAYALGFDADNRIIWKSFVGGDAGEWCGATGIAVRASFLGGPPQAYLVGTTNSPSLQCYHTLGEFFRGTFSSSLGRKAGFIARLLTSNGQRSYETYFPASDPYGSLTIEAVDIGANGRMYLTGSLWGGVLPPTDLTAPPNSADFAPVAAPQMGFVAMLDNQDRLNWRTHLPADVEDQPVWMADIAVDDSKVVVVGQTSNAGVPMTFLSGAHNVAHTGEEDLFLYEFDLDGVPRWSTYLGGPYLEELAPMGSFAYANVLSIDPVSHDIVVASTTQGSFTAIPGAGWYQGSALAGTNSMVARFSGSDRSLLWWTYVHGESGSRTRVLSTCFDADGNLYLAGSVVGPGLPLPQTGGLFHQATLHPNTSNGAPQWNNDGFILCLDADQQLYHGTYYGGDGGWDMQSIFTTLVRTTDQDLYFAGQTSKDAPAGLYLTYFPLDDGGGTPYFEDTWQGGGTEGCLARLCAELPTGIGPFRSDVQPLHVAYGTRGEVWVLGLMGGTTTYRIADTAGRAVRTGTVRVPAGTPAALDAAGLAPGVYLFQCPQGALKFLVP